MVNENNRINKICHNGKFIEYCRRNNEAETSRKFCRHDLQHFLGVARIAYILNIEKNLGYSKDIVYGAALLHDIGKWQQYEKGIPHHIASADLAKDILKECGFNQDEVNLIESAVLSHRDTVPEDRSLDFIIYYADKKSRNCYSCDAADECRWEEGKKNTSIVY